MIRRLAALLPIVAAGCGALDTPDLAHGDVAGRVSGAAPGAWVYPLGDPGRKVAVEADGRFRLSGLPAGQARLVLFDGALRAEVVEVTVAGAGLALVERSAAAMPLAGRLVMTVIPEGGVAPVAPRYRLEQTDQAGVAQGDGSAALFPLPAGPWELATEMDGFQGASDSVEVTAGATGSVEVRLQVATSGALGCTAVGEQCRNDLRCDAGDGRCYQCRLGRDDCGPGASCDPATRFCTAATGGAAIPVCSACQDDAGCGGAAEAYCQKAAGAAGGYCSRRGGCPAGFALDATDPLAPRCLAVLGCHTYFEEFGERCFSSSTCDERDGIAGGFCRGADPEEGVPGYCTAPCTLDADCIVSGFTCDPAAQVCVRSGA